MISGVGKHCVFEMVDQNGRMMIASSCVYSSLHSQYNTQRLTCVFLSPLQIVYAVQAQALKPLCDLLVVKDAKIVQVILDTILNILNEMM